VDLYAGDVGGLGEGAGGKIVSFGLTVLLDGDVEVARGLGVFKRKSEPEEIGAIRLRDRGECDGEVRIAAGWARGDGVDAGAACGGDG